MSRVPNRRHSRQICRLALLLLSTVLVLSSASAHPQGCTQCLDNTAATPPKTQAAYRHAIIFMTVSAGSLFIGTLVLLKRHR